MAVRISVSPIGAVVGALIGAVARPLAINLQVGELLRAEDTGVVYAVSTIENFLKHDPPSWWAIALSGVVAGGSGGLAEFVSQKRKGGATAVGPTDCDLTKSN